MFRALRILANTPLVPPPAPLYPVIPLKKLSTSAPFFQADSSPKSQKHKEEDQSRDEQSGPQAATTDEIAHSDSAYDPSTTNPKQSAQRVEQEKGQGTLQNSAANPKASKPPKEARP